MRWCALVPGEGAVLLHTGSGASQALNASGALIWALLEDGPSLGALLERLAAAAGGTPAELRRDVVAFLSQLRADALVEVEPASQR